jgi:anti-anti-sigma regulatory factor
MKVLEMMMEANRSLTTRQPVKSRQSRRYIAASGLTRRQSAVARRNVQRPMPHFSHTYRLGATLNESGRPIAPGQFVLGGISAMIRISQIHEGSKSHLFVEGTLSGDWVVALEESWLEAQMSSSGEPTCIDLSGVTYIDDKGRELLARMVRDGVELRATGVMTRGIIEEITNSGASSEAQLEQSAERQS